MDVLAYLAIAVIAYLLGSISTGMLVSKAMGGPDLHKVGSGNTGATNALRTMGKKGGAIVFAGDVVKALLACLVGRLWMGQNGALLAGLFVILGHNWPVFFGFKGGKGVSAGAAIALCIDWRAGLLTIAVFAIAALCSKKVSFGSICAALSLPVWALVLELSQPRCALAIVGMCLVVIRHRENIKRLINGTEPDFKPGKSKRARETDRQHN